MRDLYDLLFGPIGREYCEYFKIMMYLSFFGLILSIIGLFWKIVVGKLNGTIFLTYLIGITQIGLIYFVYRLFYSMCIR